MLAFGCASHAASCMALSDTPFTQGLVDQRATNSGKTAAGNHTQPAHSNKTMGSESWNPVSFEYQKERYMFQVTTGTAKDGNQFADLMNAAQYLLDENMGNYPRVVNAAGETLIEVESRYIPGDCYEPCGYTGNTPEARLALNCALALRRINREIDKQAAEAKKNLIGLAFQADSTDGVVRVRLSWGRLMGFSMEIREADTGHLVYSRWLDNDLGRKGGEWPEPTLEHYVNRATDFGVILPEHMVDVIRRRALLNDYNGA